MKPHGLAPGSKGQVPSLEARICSSDQEIAHLAEYGDHYHAHKASALDPV